MTEPGEGVGDGLGGEEGTSVEEGHHEEVEKKKTTAAEFIEQLKEGPSKVKEWYKAYCEKPPRFDAFLANPDRNRYPNTILYDSSRVVLKPTKGESDNPYIHASWVDSFERKHGYILSQAPFTNDTDFDFWRMVIQTKPIMIVVLTNVKNGDINCIKQFWPNEREMKDYGNIVVKCENVDNERDHNRYDLLVDYRDKLVCSPPLIAYSAWTEDKELPDSLLEFRATTKIIKARQTQDAKKKPSESAPVMLVCPSGVHRAGTFAALDILLDRISAERKVGLAETVSILRSQRFGCLSMFNHYSTVASIVVRHAVSCNIVNPDALLGKKE